MDVEQAKMLKKSVVTVFFLVCIVSIMSLGSYWWNHVRFMESTDNCYVKADIVPIVPKIFGYVDGNSRV